MDETRGGRLRALPRRGVDERASPPHEARQQFVLLVAVVDTLDAQEDVRPIESRDQHLRLAQAEQRRDVVADLESRRRRKRRDRRTAGAAVTAPARRGGVGQAAVIRPEVVPPLRHAVRLVDDESRDIERAQHLQKLLRCEALGRDIEQTQRAAPCRGDDMPRSSDDNIECSAPERMPRRFSSST
jgi:hypothetical protein